MTVVDWSIKGPHFANCNCDYGCPCQFVALPTDGTCKAVTAWRIDQGHFGDVNLDGLFAVALYSWDNPVHEGNGTMQLIIDERADDAQREALGHVMQGECAEDGATMLTIYRAMCPTVLDPLYKPIDLTLDVDGRTARLSVPGVVETQIEPLKNPVTGAEHRASIYLPNGLEFRQAAVASGTSKVEGDMAMAFENSHSHFVDTKLTSSGLEG